MQFDDNELAFDTVPDFDSSVISPAKRKKLETQVITLEGFTLDNASRNEVHIAQTKILELNRILEMPKRKPAATRFMDIMEMRDKLQATAFNPTYVRDWDMSDAPPLRKKRISGWMIFSALVCASWGFTALAFINA